MLLTNLALKDEILGFCRLSNGFFVPDHHGSKEKLDSDIALRGGGGGLSLKI